MIPEDYLKHIQKDLTVGDHKPLKKRVYSRQSKMDLVYNSLINVPENKLQITQKPQKS